MTSAKHVKIEQGEWVVVCDGSKALFLENAGDSKFPNLKTREVLEQKVPPTSEIGSDAPGRSHSSVGHGRSSIEQTDFHTQQEIEFLRGIAAKLDVAKYMENEARFRMVELRSPERYAMLVAAAREAVQQRRALYEHLSRVHLPSEKTHG